MNEWTQISVEIVGLLKLPFATPLSSTWWGFGLLLADGRTIRTRPAEDASRNARANYDAALFNVKYPRHARFKGLVRATVAFRRMRLRAAQAVYAPGGAGFGGGAAHFNTAAAAL